MKKLISIFILFICATNVAQKKDDCNDLDNIIYTIAKVKKSDTIRVCKQKIDFKDKDVFFTKAFLENYTYNTLGVDSEKVKKLISELNFEYLSKAQRKCNNLWKFNELNKNIVEFRDTVTSSNNNIVRYQISCPVYSKNKKTKFYYVEQNRGFVGGVSTSVWVFKKIKKTWILYIEFPISIS
jgi:hypothetical protein